MEMVALKCRFYKNYDELLKMFGFEKNKVVTEVERFLGKKLNKP